MGLAGHILWLVGAAWYLLLFSYEQWQPDIATSLRWWGVSKRISVAAVLGGLVLVSQSTAERLLWAVVALLAGTLWYLGRNKSVR